MADKSESGEVTVPRAILETVTAAALVSAGKLVYDASKDTYVALKPDKPLQVAITDSITTSGSHEISAAITNLGIHAVYLEGVKAIDPKGVSIKAYDAKTQQIGWDVASLGEGKETVELKPAFPCRMQPSETIKINFDVSLLAEKRLQKAPYAKLALQYRVLGVASNLKQHQFGVAIRPPESE